MSYTPESIHAIVEYQRNYFMSGETLDVNFRIEQLKKLRRMVMDHQDDMTSALAEDLGRHKTEGFFCDVGPVIAEINEILEGIQRWARPETHFSGLTCFPSVTTKVYKMPYGVTLIISPFNFPFLLSLGVLAASLAGGNTAVIKASSKSEACTRVLQQMIAETFPSNYITVVDGGHDIADLCLEERFDKIFYTGSPKVGSHVMQMAAKHLTPVALELGGETGNWCIIRKDANLKDAARKIAFFKLCNSGQICININQVAVAEEVADEFLRQLKKAYQRMIGDALTNREYPWLINRDAYDKCATEAAEYGDRIIYGGKGNPETCCFEPTIIYPVKADESIVTHELFSPLLPIVPYPDEQIDDILRVIASREHGLALYLFTKDRKWADQVFTSQQYGGGGFNEVCLHLMVKGVPFNGTGHSGMGAYHGEWGFREFTHPSTVLYGQTFGNLPLREHPYGGAGGAWKMAFLKLFER